VADTGAETHIYIKAFRQQAQMKNIVPANENYFTSKCPINAQKHIYKKEHFN